MVAPVAMPLRVVLGNAATAEHNAAVLKAAFQVRTEGRHAPEDRGNGRAAALRALLRGPHQPRTPEQRGGSLTFSISGGA